MIRWSPLTFFAVLFASLSFQLDLIRFADAGPALGEGLEVPKICFAKDMKNQTGVRNATILVFKGSVSPINHQQHAVEARPHRNMFVMSSDELMIASCTAFKGKLSTWLGFPGHSKIHRLSWNVSTIYNSVSRCLTLKTNALSTGLRLSISQEIASRIAVKDATMSFPHIGGTTRMVWDATAWTFKGKCFPHLFTVFWEVYLAASVASLTVFQVVSAQCRIVRAPSDTFKVHLFGREGFLRISWIPSMSPTQRLFVS